MTTDDVSARDVVRILVKNVNILKSEGRSPDVSLDFRDKFELFGKLSCSLTDKLQSLLYLSENYVCASDFKLFISEIVGSWSSINKQVREKCSKIHVGSRSLSGTPLSELLKKIKRERSLTRELLHVREAEYSREYLAKCYVLLNEIEELIRNLERSDDKLQQYIAILKLNPFLVKLVSVIDEYVSSIEISPIDRSMCPKLDVFPVVAKLLTGELLDDEPMDPSRVLADNVPRKPVFIIKIKRRVDVPSMAAVENDVKAQNHALQCKSENNVI
ncbi:PREDICTED: uncharacterized protein LOC105566786 [Vollenhovia emeryi]|uniref:uncharacterized protein LOC105566786 n=1 Tax=Vollenhovia emeryi TaxID=411798 RepID=UPI0005F52DC2|nr:PREDICTED: uncharacterized protein LOC105566786 [Vollenhovia emeryi]